MDDQRAHRMESTSPGSGAGASGSLPDTARLIDTEVKRIIEESFGAACALLGGHRDRLERLARALLAEETLDEAEIRRIAGDPDSRVPRAS
jgi:cell division protease FtsH